MASSTSEQGSRTKGVYVVGVLCLWLFATAAFFGACPTYPVCSLFAVFLASALLGSIPWGVIISRVFYHTDVREHGSGNIGTTNAMRTMGKVGGSAVFLLDFGKGLASGLLAYAALCIVVSAGVSQTSAPVAYEDLTAMAFLGCVWGTSSVRGSISTAGRNRRGDWMPVRHVRLAKRAYRDPSFRRHRGGEPLRLCGVHRRCPALPDFGRIPFSVHGISPVGIRLLHRRCADGRVGASRKHRPASGGNRAKGRIQERSIGNEGVFLIA